LLDQKEWPISETVSLYVCSIQIGREIEDYLVGGGWDKLKSLAAIEIIEIGPFPSLSNN
jgi:hypothetical protein